MKKSMIPTEYNYDQLEQSSLLEYEDLLYEPPPSIVNKSYYYETPTSTYYSTTTQNIPLHQYYYSPPYLPYPHNQPRASTPHITSTHPSSSSTNAKHISPQSPTNPTVQSAIQPTASSEMSTDFLLKNSCSRRNFSARICRHLFSEEERKSGNVGGKNNKAKLCPKKISQIYDATFKMFPLLRGEDKQKCLSACIKTIDEANRRLLMPSK